MLRILFSSHVFAPAVGGIERVSELLAAEFAAQGHDVHLITQTGGPVAGYPYPVSRRPGARELLRLTRWCDVCFHNNISLPRAWPLLLVRRPWVIAHHVWIPRSGVAARLKRLALRFATGISVSSAIARHVDAPSTIIPNPYDDGLFRILPGVPRNRDLVFVGRLVSDKGVFVLLEALALLAARKFRPRLTVVGDGPEKRALIAKVEALDLQGRVVFPGTVRGEALVRILNEHRVLVAPSLWDEPFGLVALEGIACGCVPVGSAGGGLKEAMGECGETFPNGNASALARVIESLLLDPARQTALREKAPEHLRRHTRSAVAAAYLDVFAQALAASSMGTAEASRV